MPTTWNDSYADKLPIGTASGEHAVFLAKVRDAVDGGPILPSSAMMLTAVAADLLAAIESRNQVPSVIAAHAALKSALASLNAMTDMLDG